MEGFKERFSGRLGAFALIRNELPALREKSGDFSQFGWYHGVLASSHKGRGFLFCKISGKERNDTL